MMFTERERRAFARHEEEQRFIEASQPFAVRLQMLAAMQRTALALSPTERGRPRPQGPRTKSR
jgi:hypothetical protein